MPKFRKKPVVIEARQYTHLGEGRDIVAWINSEGGRADGPYYYQGDVVMIGTLEGDMRANLGDWVIKGVKGEFYPCKPDIFQQTYEPVIEDAYTDEEYGGSGVEPEKPVPYQRPKRLWPWDFYISFWAWLRYGLLLTWRCQDCGKFHISRPSYWSDHILMGAPLCTACQDRMYDGYERALKIAWEEGYRHPHEIPKD